VNIDKKDGDKMNKRPHTFPIFSIRRCWYLILLVASTLYVVLQRKSIGPLSVMTVQNLIFYIWLLLLFFPLFSEMEIMGIKLKKEVEKATKGVKDSITELKLQIMDLKISNSNANSLSLTFSGDVPSRQEVLEINKKQQPQETGDKKELNTDEIVTDETVYLFKVRLTIERALRSFCERLNCDEHSPIIQLLSVAVTNNFIDRKTADYIRQIVTICNRGIHGEIVSNEYIDFVKSILPQVLDKINTVTSKMGHKYYFVCPRCKYAGYAEHENVCPSCGLITDDD